MLYGTVLVCFVSYCAFFQYVSCSNINERIKQVYLHYMKTSYNDFSLLHVC